MIREMEKITSPKEFFGFVPGSDCKLIRWDKIVEYFYLLQKESERIKVIDMGPTTEGNPFLQVVISSLENLSRLDEIKRISHMLAECTEITTEERDELVKKGVCICVQNMSIHAREIGGTQMSPLLAYELLSSSRDEVLNILKNVVLVMIPCANPDGQIAVTNFYNEYKNTEYEGSSLPVLCHKYAGHDTNRDAIFNNLVESKYINKIIFWEWLPQVFVDHHQMGSYKARMFVPPYKNPIKPYVNPLTVREQGWYGINISYDLEAAGISGVVSNSLFANEMLDSLSCATSCSNITGILTESANAKFASPRYIHPVQLKTINNYPPEYRQVLYPNPWKGGWWRLSDIVKQQFLSAMSVLNTMSVNKERILLNTHVKALTQLKEGERQDIKAFIIPPAQDGEDEGARKELLRILLQLRIVMKVAEEEFIADKICYPKGTVIVPVAQPKFCLVMNLLCNPELSMERLTMYGEAMPEEKDMLTNELAAYLGTKVIAANKISLPKLQPFCEIPSTVHTGVYKASNTESYIEVNRLLKNGVKVYRTPEGFNTASGQEIKQLKIAVFQRYIRGNSEEGWTRFVLDKFGFSYSTVMDFDVYEGLVGYDVLILPSDKSNELDGNPKVFETEWVGAQPDKYKSGLKEQGKAALKNYVEKGGTLLAFNESCDYVIDALGLKVTNVLKNLPKEKFRAHGSILKVKLNKEHWLCYGMQEEANIVYWHSPAFSISETFNAQDYEIVATYGNSCNILRSGYIKGEEQLHGKAALLCIKYGIGRVILYGFSPLFRAQSYGTFRLVFNALLR
jgi:hypothetical protein